MHTLVGSMDAYTCGCIRLWEHMAVDAYTFATHEFTHLGVKDELGSMDYIHF
jgi:hypothetical protein